MRDARLLTVGIGVLVLSLPCPALGAEDRAAPREEQLTSQQGAAQQRTPAREIKATKRVKMPVHSTGRGLPRLRGHLPRLTRHLPRLGHRLPRLSRRLPRLSHRLPRLNHRLPRLSHRLPRLGR